MGIYYYGRPLHLCREAARDFTERMDRHMKKYTVSFVSVTYAGKARAALNKAGIPAELRRISQNNSGGCGYSVTAEASADRIAAVLRESRIPYRSINEYGGRNEHM